MLAWLNFAKTLQYQLHLVCASTCVKTENLHLEDSEWALGGQIHMRHFRGANHSTYTQALMQLSFDHQIHFPTLSSGLHCHHVCTLRQEWCLESELKLLIIQQLLVACSSKLWVYLADAASQEDYGMPGTSSMMNRLQASTVRNHVLGLARNNA